MLKKYKMPQFVAGGKPNSLPKDVPLDYLPANAGTPESAKRPTTAQSTGAPAVRKRPTRQDTGSKKIGSA